MLGSSSIMRGALLALISAIWLGGTSVRAAAVHCTSTYDATQKASVISLLKVRYGDAYKSFDLDRPSLVDIVGLGDIVETEKGRSRVDLRGVAWIGFQRARGAKAPVGVPTGVVVAIDRCSGKAVGFIPE